MTREIRVNRFTRGIDTARLLRALARESMPAILESTRPDPLYGRYSYYTCAPVSHLSLQPGAPERSRAHLGELLGRLDPWPEVPVKCDGEAPPLTVGVVGFLAYENGALLEPACGWRQPDDRLPLAEFHQYATVLAHDHLRDEWIMSRLVEDGRCEEHPLDRILASMPDDTGQPAAPQPPLQTGNDISLPPGTVPSLPRDTYLARVERARQFIASGDIYQVNLTSRFRMVSNAEPVEHYLALRASTPASHAAFLPRPYGAVISASPELFLNIADGEVLTRPIKGTRRRTGNETRDAELARELFESEKDSAELNMIVDLLRNDLGRFCSPGSVQVREAARIECHPTLLHRVATIAGRVDKTISLERILRATFPGGSVTGAPKIRAMQIIHELEPVPRGVYCGAIGWVGANGRSAWNIPIRTMFQTGDTIDIHAGGAIVADSDPVAEYEEALAKASAMFGAVQWARTAAASGAQPEGAWS